MELAFKLKSKTNKLLKFMKFELLGKSKDEILKLKK